MLAVSARATRCLPPRAAARLPLVLATMHMAWGAGFLTSPRDLVPGEPGPRETPAHRVARLRGVLRGR